MSDLAETIAKWRKDIDLCRYDTYWIDLRELSRLLDAAEAGVRARDAALEEAAKVAEAVDPEKPGNWLHARHKIAFAIRALKGAAPATCNDCLRVQAEARAAALEEAASVADRLAKEASDDDLEDKRDLGDDYDPNSYGSGWTAGACEHGVRIAEEIRALKGAA